MEISATALYSTRGVGGGVGVLAGMPHVPDARYRSYKTSVWVVVEIQMKANECVVNIAMTADISEVPRIHEEEGKIEKIHPSSVRFGSVDIDFDVRSSTFFGRFLPLLIEVTF